MSASYRTLDSSSPPDDDRSHARSHHSLRQRNLDHVPGRQPPRCRHDVPAASQPRYRRPLRRAPLLDLLVAAFTWLPWLIAGILGGWLAVLGSLLGQLAALVVWTSWHELLHRRHVQGPRIVKFIDRTLGAWRNELALALTLIALPGFWLIRILQILAYWPLVALLDFPRYNQSDWINVSRQKFEGLVGHDLVWCLYCDWMTGVYCLGAEMLRNVESFWCPIRFYDGKKCANCAIDFPDINHGWIEPDKSMADVVALLEDKYTTGPRAHFAHPVRLTIAGKEPLPPQPIPPRLRLLQQIDDKQRHPQPILVFGKPLQLLGIRHRLPQSLDHEPGPDKRVDVAREHPVHVHQLHAAQRHLPRPLFDIVVQPKADLGPIAVLEPHVPRRHHRRQVADHEPPPGRSTRNASRTALS